ncbi:MAG: hypothetical protein COA99_13465 [Moraxellaceae bacterium]|nr:MAG: hypothetical protein COA99_13465 [Moraxellaceae bacterium]
MKYTLIQKSMIANATFSTACALTIFSYSATLSQWLGNIQPLLLQGLAVSLLSFAATLVWVATRSQLQTTLAKLITIADWAWVLATPLVIMLFYTQLSEHGIALMLAVAFAVGTCAWFQQKGLKQIAVN